VEHAWTCSCCGRSFNSLPMDYAFSAPEIGSLYRKWNELPPAPSSMQTCVIDRNEYYVRGCLEMPVSDSPVLFVWGVWISVSEESFRYVLEH